MVEYQLSERSTHNTLITPIQKTCDKISIHSEHQYRERVIKSQYTQNTNTCTEKMSVTFIWNLQLGTMKSVPPYLKLIKYINSLCS